MEVGILWRQPKPETERKGQRGAAGWGGMETLSPPAQDACKVCECPGRGADAQRAVDGGAWGSGLGADGADGADGCVDVGGVGV